jgi:TRAP-type C4-dicarboxylate transport system permease small subunit
MGTVIRVVDRWIGILSEQLTRLIMLLLVIVVLYNVLMRYGFNAPPFWSDRVGTTANMAMVLFGISLTIRNRDLIAMQALYEIITPRAALLLDALWNAVILVFSAVFAWYGYQAADAMPGQYWDFQAFCIDLGMDSGEEGVLITLFKSFEGLVGLLVQPFCVDGAVPQRVMAMLMPISGVLLLIASLGVIIEDIRKIKALSNQAQAGSGDGARVGSKDPATPRKKETEKR